MKRRALLLLLLCNACTEQIDLFTYPHEGGDCEGWREGRLSGFYCPTTPCADPALRRRGQYVCSPLHVWRCTPDGSDICCYVHAVREPFTDGLTCLVDAGGTSQDASDAASTD